MDRNWKKLKLNTTINAEIQRNINMETDYCVKVLDRLLSITLFLSKSDLAFFGWKDKFYTYNNGHFLSLVELLSKYDDITKELLHKTLSREKTDYYCNHSIQNELIDFLGNKILKNIIDRLHVAKYYSMVLDCTPDVSHCISRFFHWIIINCYAIAEDKAFTEKRINFMMDYRQW